MVLPATPSGPFSGAWRVRWISIRRLCRLASGGAVMNRRFPLAIALVSFAPVAFPQMAAKLDPGSTSQVEQRQQMLNRQALEAAHNLERAERQSWVNSMANLAKLRIKLAEAWRDMGVSPQGAKLIADAYDPNLAANMHHASVRGKSDQEIAALLQSAI